MKVILCDIDSTLADTRQRAESSPHADPEATWETYALNCGSDTLITGSARMLSLLVTQGHQVWYVSGRPVSVLDRTIRWCREHGLPDGPFRLHHKDDPADQVEYKRAHLMNVRALGFDVVLAVDDWPTVVDMYESEGVPCVCVNPRYRDDPMSFFTNKKS